jgi:hypothetical protein
MDVGSDERISALCAFVMQCPFGISELRLFERMVMFGSQHYFLNSDVQL